MIVKYSKYYIKFMALALMYLVFNNYATQCMEKPEEEIQEQQIPLLEILPAELWSEIAEYLPGDNPFLNALLVYKIPLSREAQVKIIKSYINRINMDSSLNVYLKLQNFLANRDLFCPMIKKDCLETLRQFSCVEDMEDLDAFKDYLEKQKYIWGDGNNKRVIGMLKNESFLKWRRMNMGDCLMTCFLALAFLMGNMISIELGLVMFNIVCCYISGLIDSRECYVHTMSQSFEISDWFRDDKFIKSITTLSLIIIMSLPVFFIKNKIKSKATKTKKLKAIWAKLIKN